MHILVTAGPTREYFDSVRFISNASSGKLGYCVAAEAARRGHRVSVVTGPVERPDPEGVDVIRVVSAHAMLRAATALFDECQAAVMAAAVSDYRPEQRLDHKSPKHQRARNFMLVPTEDICAHLGRIKGNRVVVGFALEDSDPRAKAERKLQRKNCDAIILNGPATVGRDEGTIQVLRADGSWDEPVTGGKPFLAEVIVELVENLVGQSRETAFTLG